MRRGLDFYANYNSGWRVLFVGGNWNNGGNAGLFYFSANNTVEHELERRRATTCFSFDWRRLSLTAW